MFIKTCLPLSSNQEHPASSGHFSSSTSTLVALPLSGLSAPRCYPGILLPLPPFVCFAPFLAWPSTVISVTPLNIRGLGASGPQRAFPLVIPTPAFHAHTCWGTGGITPQLTSVCEPSQYCSSEASTPQATSRWRDTWLPTAL